MGNTIRTTDGTTDWDYTETWTWPYFDKFAYCPRCGRKTEARENYCPVCGRYLFERNVYYTPYVDSHPDPSLWYPRPGEPIWVSINHW